MTGEDKGHRSDMGRAAILPFFFFTDMCSDIRSVFFFTGHFGVADN